MIAVLLAWWFFYPWYGGTVVGPFQTQTQCEMVRKEVGKAVTSCWADGR